MLAIHVNELVRVFGQRKVRNPAGDRASGRPIVALDRLSLSVDVGEVRGLLGPNGAGKTTLVKVLSTVLLPTSGSAEVLGHDVVASTEWVRGHIGVVFGGDRGLYGRLTVRRNLEYWATLYRVGRVRVAELIVRFGLENFADTPVDKLSRGTKQRVHLARGMLSRPDLLFLDEPTIGMDPVSAREFHRLLMDMRDGSTTILLTTHDMAEAEQLCDRVTLIDHGAVIGTETPARVGRWITAYERVEARISSAELLATLGDLPGVAAIENLDDGWVRINTSDSSAVTAALQLVVNAGVTAVRVTEPSLQEVYLQLIGERGMKV